MLDACISTKMHPPSRKRTRPLIFLSRRPAKGAFSSSTHLDFSFFASYDSCEKRTAAGILFFGSPDRQLGKGPMMKLVTCLCTFVFAFALADICFAADEVWCPDTIKVDQRAIPPSPEWVVSYNSLPHRLEMVTFFSGPPKGNASLVYDEKSKIKGGWTGTWGFPRDASGYWIQCSYRGTLAELSRRLPDWVNVCRVTYDDGSRFPSGLPVILKIECR